MNYIAGIRNTEKAQGIHMFYFVQFTSKTNLRKLFLKRKRFYNLINQLCV